jgi:prepilin-type N-terminal cleavage/methylation domain-containing protein
MVRAFTLLELLIVILIIAALAAIGFWAAHSVIARARLNQATVLVHGVASEAGRFAAHDVTALDGRIYAPFTLGQSPGMADIDGDPARYPSSDPLVARAPAGYRGFVALSGIALPPQRVNERGQPIDPWRHPLQIAWAANTYGSASLGVWSLGPPGGAPITSWGDSAP